MIALASDCLLFRLTSGESVPFSAEMISVELLGDTAKESDPDLLDEAAKAVFHYFKHDLERNCRLLRVIFASVLFSAAEGGIAPAVAASPAPGAFSRAARGGQATGGRPPLGSALSRPGGADCGLFAGMRQRGWKPEGVLVGRGVRRPEGTELLTR